MKPNLTAAAALARALLVLAAASFFGALVLPLSAGGELPATWGAWKPVLGTAFGAMVAQEVIYVRMHLASLASAMGLPAPQTVVNNITTEAAKAAVKVAGTTLVALALVAFVGCAGLFGAGSAVLDCGSKVTADAAQGMSLPQILADLPSQCGMDLAQIIALLAASKDPNVQHSKAYTEALKARAELLAMPEPAPGN